MFSNLANLNDDTLLWFIILFVLLFCCGCGRDRDRVGGIGRGCCND